MMCLRTLLLDMYRDNDACIPLFHIVLMRIRKTRTEAVLSEAAFALLM